MKLNLFAALALATTLAATAHAAGSLGQEAPALKIATWTKGKPVDLGVAKGKQIVVVEFWATWCGPCRQSIPHLTELQKKFKDQVIFVGVSDEAAGTVKPFVEKMGDKMDYVVAVDAKRQTSVDYMEGFGVNGIPHAFIVDKGGKIVWHGHPMAEMEDVLEEVIAGKYDLTKAKQRDDGRQKLEEFYRLAGEDKDPARQDQLAREITALETEIGSLNPNQKFDAAAIRKMIKFDAALRSYQILLATNGAPEILAPLEKQLEQNGPPDFVLAEFKESAGFSKIFGDYYRAASGRGDQAKLPELTKKLGEIKSSNFELLNEWAWTLLTDESIKQRDLALATKLAKAAVTASDGKEPATLDTYARALFDSGKVSEAIEQQKLAIAQAKDDDMRKDLQQTLKRYEAKTTKK